MAGKSSSVDQELIRDLANILKEADLSEIEIEQGTLRIKLSRIGTPFMSQAPMMMSANPQTIQQQIVPISASPALGVPESAALNNAHSVPSPMVGTVYFAPGPGADPFVTIGSKIKEGQTIVIIEAMKTMNQIPAPKSGTVTAILVDDASPVEFGQPLIAIE
jgi:acetyl-CoA carboxylase biotin carboxyl carrier protein